MDDHQRYQREVQEAARKERDFAEFRRIVEADVKMPPDAYHVDMHQARGDALRAWPRGGGPQYVYWHKVTDTGDDELINDPNQPFFSREERVGSRVVNKWERMGYRRLNGEELLAVVDRQQSRARARMAERVERLKQVADNGGSRVVVVEKQVQAQAPRASR